MQQIDIGAAKASKATERRALAILAYDNASADPATANWEGVAHLLRLAIPATKAKAEASAELGAETGAPWHDYDIPANATKKLGKSPIVTVTFACGAVVRSPAVSLPGKPVNIGRGLRVAFAFYRARIAREFGKAFAAGSDCVNVPAIVSAVCDSGDEFDAATCNAKTAEYRRGEFDHIALAAEAEAFPIEAEAEALTRAEFYRARYLIAKARAALPGAEAEAAAELGATIEDYGLRLGGMPAADIWKRRRDIQHTAHLAAEAEGKAEGRRARVAAYLERRAARAAVSAALANLATELSFAAPAEAPSSAEAEAIPALAAPAEAEAVPPADSPAEAVPVAPSCEALQPLPVAADSPDQPRRLPVAPSRASRFLASTSLAAPGRGLPVAPSLAIRIAA